jgi:hypothetical protein
MHAPIQADRVPRSQALLAGGVDRLLRNLHPQVTWRPPVLQVFNYEDHDIFLQGRGLILLPFITGLGMALFTAYCPN